MKDEIYQTINSVIIEYENNQQDKIWKEPIIGIISADNEKLKILKEVVSEDHLMPRDILPDAKSIISFFIPFEEHVINSNIEGEMASRQWAQAYIKTNELINEINEKMEKLMTDNGKKAGKIPATHNFDDKKLISSWSHRHIAYIAGLGTFGINNMLITRSGCCGRVGSIVVNHKFDEYTQTDSLKEKCLNKNDGSCGICRSRCVADAFADNVFDRHKCYEQCLKNAQYHKEIGFADVCGKCMVGVGCSGGGGGLPFACN